MGFKHLEGVIVGLLVREAEAIELAHFSRAAEIAVLHDLDPAAEPPFHLGLQLCMITRHIVTLSSLFIPAFRGRCAAASNLVRLLAQFFADALGLHCIPAHYSFSMVFKNASIFKAP